VVAPLNVRVEENPVRVTALIVTYNHKAYVRDAIDSALGQRTDFPLEIIVSEDASTDGTREIVEGYAAKHRDRIRLLLSPTNLRSNETVARGLRAARGRYVALLDGDDRWTVVDKLQRQADFLDAHPEHSAHFFNAVIDGDTPRRGALWTTDDQPAVVDFAGIWHGNPYATSGSMMRTAAVRDVPAWYAGFFPITDWPLYILCARQGTLYFDREAAAAYRLHEGGLFSALHDRTKLERTYDFYRRMDRCLEGRHSTLARAGCGQIFYDWAWMYLRMGKLDLAATALRMSILGGNEAGVSLRKSMGLAWRIAKARLGHA
jgi:glycosyltransferase involved in cell wall biosynthesis